MVPDRSERVNGTRRVAWLQPCVAMINVVAGALYRHPLDIGVHGRGSNVGRGRTGERRVVAGGNLCWPPDIRDKRYAISRGQGGDRRSTGT